MKNLALLIPAALVLAACSDTTGPIDSELGSGDDPSFAISDGSNDGNEHFYFLPPMVKSPSYSGTFDPTLRPEVQICVWRITDEECGPNLEMYTMDTGPGSETVRVNEADEMYIVNWHTEDILGAFPLGEDEVYRIRILAEGKELGFADVVVVSSGKELKNYRTSDLIPLIDGHRMPVKFRIEEGALGPAEPVSAGHKWHTCAIAADGSAYCWGYNWYGQLGDGTHTAQRSPVAVVGGIAFEAIGAGREFTCGIADGGDAYCWGRNNRGQLGTGANSATPSDSPVPVIGGHSFVRISAGGSHSCGLTAAGDVYCWGWNYYGQVGRGVRSEYESQPVQIASNAQFVSISAGPYHSCGVTAANEAYCWGWNRNGQLGNGQHGSFEVAPVAVVGGLSFSSLDAGLYHTCGVTTDRGAFCWGLNEYGQVGNGGQSYVVSGPAAVVGGHTLVKVSAGEHQSCGLTDQGAGFCWGHNGVGELGTGSRTPYELSPIAVTGAHVFTSISAGSGHTCAATTGGDVYCWGWNRWGQVGSGDWEYVEPTPEYVLDLDPNIP